MDLRQRLASLAPDKLRRFMASLSGPELNEVELLTETLFEFIPRISKLMEPPLHLRAIVVLFEQAEHGEQRAVVSTPPQHGKTVTAAHALAWYIARNPTKRCGYVTYEANRAEQISQQVRDLLTEAGVKTTGSRKIWKTAQGGGLIATGIGGPLTGYGIDGILVVDDPVKNRAVAESSLYRERTDQWFRDVALTRVHPGASVFVIQTRWHDDDLAGRLIKRGWRKINLQAIATKDEEHRKEGESLWPEKRPAEWLARVRVEVGEYTWWSLYQGEPRPRGGALFKNVTLHRGEPKLDDGYEVAGGLDLAYSKRTHADWSVAVVMARAVRRDHTKKPVFYVLDVQRKQVQAPVFKNILRGLRATWKLIKFRWYASGTEKGVGDFLSLSDGEDPGLEINVLPAVADKFVRAQQFAAAWNDGRVLVPEDAEWASVFVGEICDFTGVNDANDDQVDAGGSAYDELAPTSDLEFFEQMSTVT